MMLTPEEFVELKKSIEDGNPIDNETGQKILQTILEMDANIVIMQNALELGVQNAQEVIPAVAEKVLAMSGRTDGKSRKKAAKYAADVTARYQIAIQLYLAGAAEKAQELLAGGFSDSEETETAQEADNDEPNN
jgi:hypothetical protein